MTAKEMLKKLGYGMPKFPITGLLEKQYLQYENRAEDIRIDFNLTNKVVTIADYAEGYTLDVPTLKALYKQCEELGWFDEKNNS